MYSKIILNLFNNPKNAGRISKPDGIADTYNIDSTAHVEFSLRIENGIITDCKFRAQANPYIIAICSTMTTMAKGKMMSMLFIDSYSVKQELEDESAIDIEFCIDCLKMAIQDYKDKLEKENKKSSKESTTVAEENVATIQQPLVEENTAKTEQDDDDDFADFFDDFFDEDI